MKVSNISNIAKYERSYRNKNTDKIERGKFDSILISKNVINDESKIFDINEVKTNILSKVNADISAEKFTQIKAQIDSGSYETNASSLADLLMNIE